MELRQTYVTAKLMVLLAVACLLNGFVGPVLAADGTIQAAICNARGGPVTGNSVEFRVDASNPGLGLGGSNTVAQIRLRDAFASGLFVNAFIRSDLSTTRPIRSSDSLTYLIRLDDLVVPQSFVILCFVGSDGTVRSRQVNLSQFTTTSGPGPYRTFSYSLANVDLGNLPNPRLVSARLSLGPAFQADKLIIVGTITYQSNPTLKPDSINTTVQGCYSYCLGSLGSRFEDLKARIKERRQQVKNRPGDKN